MPLYEYECTNCHYRFEKIESYSAPEKRKCPKCGKVAGRVLAAPAIQFKGTGWYVTDYGGKSAGAASKAAKVPAPSGDGNSAKPAAEKTNTSTASADKGSTKK